ncbi:MAG: transglutaminaseTgpA domain-containing protein, partial [Chromatocurvus sp.]
MKSADLIPRNALAWIIGAQLLLLLPHVLRLPIWIVLLYAISFVWRVQIYRGRWPVPGRWLKLVLIGAAITGVGWSYGSVIGLEPTVALLLVAFA